MRPLALLGRPIAKRGSGRKPNTEIDQTNRLELLSEVKMYALPPISPISRHLGDLGCLGDGVLGQGGGVEAGEDIGEGGGLTVGLFAGGSSCQ
jgi:hypothetical protein